jgi:pimeloyl-ACP methyl ester carboxylesterase
MPGASRNSPAVLLLHALMSASDAGYRRLASRWNARGWTVVFPHLPFHYSRTPLGTWNGELAITADLVRNAEGVRQAVMEMRQLMAWLRSGGTREFGLVGTSYGGWTGALLASVEADWRFVALVQPIVNMDKAVWESPGSAVLRRELRRLGHSRGGTEWFDHLGSPLHSPLACEAGRIVVTAGLHDRVSPMADLEAAAGVWGGCELLHAEQGHFGYAALRETVCHIERRGWI